MYLCVEDIISSKHKYIERGKPISSTYKYLERGKTDILNTQIHRKM
jgi:hypothetical protein